MTRATDPAVRIALAQQLLGQGLPRAMVVQRLAAEFGITDRQARRIVAEAERGMPADWHAPPIAPVGSAAPRIDVLAEAVHLYQAAKGSGKLPDAIRALQLVAKLQREAEACRPMSEQWDDSLAADAISDLPPDMPF